MAFPDNRIKSLAQDTKQLFSLVKESLARRDGATDLVRLVSYPLAAFGMAGLLLVTTASDRKAPAAPSPHTPASSSTAPVIQTPPVASSSSGSPRYFYRQDKPSPAPGQ